MLRNKNAHKENGNVLFLILIAVALFAALSYAVTQSTRSGTGATDREQSLLGSATITQYPNSLRTAIIRMTLSGLDVRLLAFNAPGDFAGVSVARLVFHPDGGGATYQQSPADVMSAAVSANWSHNLNLAVPGLGSDNAGGNDLIAFLPGVNQITCERINSELGIGGASTNQCGSYQGDVPIVSISSDANITTDMDNTYVTPASPAQMIQCTGGSANAYTGKATGCFYDSTLVSGGTAGSFVFYSVLLER